MKPMGQTKLLGVVGWPVGQSRSPAMHNAALKALGLDFTYVTFAVPPDKFSKAVAGAAALGMRGLNVTIPHKEAALRLCEPDALGREAGAVNTLIFAGDVVHGTNTDVHGFRMLMAENRVQAGPTGTIKTVILGAGGATRAVVLALRTVGARAVTIVSRKGQPITVGDQAVPARVWSAEVLRRELQHADLLVDATPRGLDSSSEPIDLSPLPPHAVVLDLVVKRETALVAAARARGLAAATGAAMLLHQGAQALERWLGRPAPIDVMRAALEASLEANP
jgi:shikimate dehydrogenase